MGRLVILSGPSCVGKSPLYAALRKFYPHLAERLTKLVLYDSRAPRPGEVEGVDFYFRTRAYLEGLRGKEGFTVFEVRGDLQALDARELERKLAAYYPTGEARKALVAFAGLLEGKMSPLVEKWKQDLVP